MFIGRRRCQCDDDAKSMHKSMTWKESSVISYSRWRTNPLAVRVRWPNSHWLGRISQRTTRQPETVRRSDQWQHIGQYAKMLPFGFRFDEFRFHNYKWAMSELYYVIVVIVTQRHCDLAVVDGVIRRLCCSNRSGVDIKIVRYEEKWCRTDGIIYSVVSMFDDHSHLERSTDGWEGTQWFFEAVFVNGILRRYAQFSRLLIITHAGMFVS